MGRLRALTAHSRFALHGFYFFLVFLILIFLIFSAVSGPGTKYYWLSITLKADAKTKVAGARWSLGGLGACDGNSTYVSIPVRADLEDVHGMRQALSLSGAV
jgi:hypothetical protein